MVCLYSQLVLKERKSSWELSVPSLRLFRRIWEDYQGAELCTQCSFRAKMFDALWGCRGEAPPNKQHLHSCSEGDVALWKGAEQEQLCREQPGRPGCLSLQPENRSATSSRQRFGAGCQGLLVCSHSCSWMQPWGSFLRLWEELGSLEAARAN